jgi:hypothetical protein
MRYLWSLGYYVRRNVPLTETWDKSEQTDIDVLGIRVDDEFNSDFVVCDCKSGVTASTKTRLFWLSGVMKYFGASRGIFVRSQKLGTKYIELAESLGIAVLSEDLLIELEKSYEIDPGKYVGPFNREHEKADILLGRAKTESKDLYEYVRIRYWEDPPHQQILSLLPRAKELSQLKNEPDGSTFFQLAYILSLLSMSVLRLSRALIMVSPPQREEVARLSVLGGRIGYQERTELLEGFHDFMVREIETRYKEKYPISRRQFAENVLPPFSKYLADLVVRICQTPRAAVALPRVMDLLTYDVVLSREPSRMKELKNQYPDLSIKQIIRVTKDYWAFAERSGITSPDLSQALDKALEHLEAQTLQGSQE